MLVRVALTMDIYEDEDLGRDVEKTDATVVEAKPFVPFLKKGRRTATFQLAWTTSDSQNPAMTRCNHGQIVSRLDLNSYGRNFHLLLCRL